VPPLPPAANVIKITMRMTTSNNTHVIDRVFVHYTGTAPTNAQLVTFATAIATAWNANLASQFTVEKALVEVDCVDLTSATSAVGNVLVTHAGTDPGPSQGVGTAAMLNYKISRRYRGGKPRTYLAALSADDTQTDSTWTAASMAALLAAWQAFITAIQAAPWAGATIDGQVNVSFYSGFTNFTGPTGRQRARSTPRAGAAVVDTITSVSVNPIIASQRRRNRP
jgi:hypothetical protein